MIRFIKKHSKQVMSFALIGALAASSLLYGFSDKNKSVEAKTTSTKTDSKSTVTTVGNTKTPKYVFMFIGDGMSFPQVQITSD